MEKKITYLDRNEYNYGPCPAVGEVLKNFDPNNLCFYTRIYDEGKKSIFSDVRVRKITKEGKMKAVMVEKIS